MFYFSSLALIRYAKGTQIFLKCLVLKWLNFISLKWIGIEYLILNTVFNNTISIHLNNSMCLQKQTIGITLWLPDGAAISLYCNSHRSNQWLRIMLSSSLNINTAAEVGVVRLLCINIPEVEFILVMVVDGAKVVEGTSLENQNIL